MGYSIENLLPVQNAYTKEPSGFISPESVIVTYSASTRKITLTGTVIAYWQGRKIDELVSGWVSTAHTDSADRYFLYYNGSTFVWSTLVWTFDMVQIAEVIYEGSGVGWAIREPHGLMQADVHKELHNIQGTYLFSGGGATDLSYTLNSTTAANRRPLFNTAIIADEDLPTSIAALLSASYCRVELGTGLAYTMTTGSADIVNLNGNVPYYNQINAGNGSQVAMTNNQYQKLFVVALPTTADTPSQDRRFAIFQGQTVSTTLSTIQAITFRSMQKGTFGSLIAEFVPIIEIIIRYVGGGTNNWSLIEVNSVNESKGATSIVGQTGLTSVAATNYLTGNGTPALPLSINGTGTASAVVYDTGTEFTESADFTYNNTTKQITVGGAIFSKRVLYKQGADVANGNITTVGADGNAFNFTNATELQLLDSTDFQYGARITIKFNQATLIRNNVTSNLSNKSIILSCGTDYTTKVNQILEFEYRSDAKWYEIGESTFINTVVTNGVWTQTTAFNGTPTTPSRIATTSNLTTLIKKGYGLKIKLSSTYYYAIVTDITSTYIDLKGDAYLTGTIAEVWYCDSRNFITYTYVCAPNSLNATNANDILIDASANAYNYLPDRHDGSKARLVLFSARTKNKGSGSNPAINVKIGANSTSALNVALALSTSDTWFDSGVTIQNAYNTKDYGESEKVIVTTAGTGASELTCKFTYIYE